MLAAILVAVTTAACGSSSSDSCNTASPIYSQIQGTWSMCAPSSATSSMKNTIVVNGCGVGITNTVYIGTTGTPNLTCTGTGVVALTGTGTATIGGSQLAGFNDGRLGQVTAYQLDIAATMLPTGSSTGTAYAMYTIGYVGAVGGTALNTLYMGDTSGANDGTTPAKRPTVLEAFYPFTKQ